MLRQGARAEYRRRFVPLSGDRRFGKAPAQQISLVIRGKRQFSEQRAERAVPYLNRRGLTILHSIGLLTHKRFSRRTLAVPAANPLFQRLVHFISRDAAVAGVQVKDSAFGSVV